MSSAGVSDLCFLKSSVNAAVYQDIQDILEYFMVPAADQLMSYESYSNFPKYSNFLASTCICS